MYTRTELYKLFCNDSWTKIWHLFLVFLVFCVSPLFLSLDSCNITVRVVVLILHYTSVIILCILSLSLESVCLALYFVATFLPTCTDLVLL